MTSKAFKTVLNDLAERSLRIVVSPTPVTFSERRSVLQALQKLGPIEVLKMDLGFQSHFISITKDVATARDLVDRSPLTYNAHKLRSRRDPTLADSDEPVGVETVINSTSTTSTHEESRQFTLRIFPSPGYSHKGAAATSPLHQSWQGRHEEDKSFTATLLRQTLPPSPAAEGLAHWLHDLQDPAPVDKAELAAKAWVPSRMQRVSQWQEDVTGRIQHAIKSKRERQRKSREANPDEAEMLAGMQHD